MRISREIFWLLILIFVQQLPMVADRGIDLPLIFVVLVGVRSNALPAAGWGLVTGIIQDLLSAGGVGTNTIAKIAVGLGSSFFKMHIYREKILTQTLLISGMSAFHEFFSYFLMRLNGEAPRAGDAFWVCAQSVLFTTLTGLVVCFFVVRFRRRRFDPATA
jgi:rod shape-determining protein MreD